MYLIFQDMKRLIQSDNLLQVIGSDLSILNSIQLAAQAEAISYLIQKYVTSQEFTDTNVYNPATIYKANDRVYLDAPQYNGANTYALNSLVLQAGNVYICNTAITAAEVFTAGKWTLLGTQYAMFFVTLPYSKFNYLTYYLKGMQVFWNKSTYVSKVDTVPISHEGALQSGTYSNEPQSNVFPDDPLSGVAYWGTGVPYTIAAYTLPTDASKWTAGDNRNPQLVNYLIDIALYHVHSRIAPRNIPELRVKRYDDAVCWLKMAGQGKITADLALIQPRSGNRIRYGGTVKQINSY